MLSRLSQALSLTGRFKLSLYLLCTGIAITTLLAALLVHWLLARNQTAWTHEYGQALANLSAHRALDSTLNHDLVSLQVILSDVVENPAVVNATIHDVENNLLVQAGSHTVNAKLMGKRYLNFNSPITLHNSIAGYVTVTMDVQGHNPFAGQLWWLFGLLGASLVALVLIYGYFYGSQGMQTVTTQKAIPIVTSPTPLLTMGGGADDESNGAEYHVQLQIALLNYGELAKQLNSNAFRSVNQRLEQQLNGVMALYSGNLLYAQHHIIYLRFHSNESEADAVFKGLCAALLMQQLNQQPTSFPLQLAILLCDGEDSRALLKRLPYHFADQEDYQQLLQHAADKTLLAQVQLLQDPEINARIETCTSDGADDVIQVVAVHENYQNLLDRQLQQLAIH